MIENIKQILDNNDKVHSYVIRNVVNESKELFFVKKDLDMNRAKKVEYFNVTVYHDFEEGEMKFKGDSTVKLAPNMSLDEMAERIEQAALSASFVKNPFYELVSKSDQKVKKLSSNFSDKDISEFLPELIDAMYKHDNYNEGGINSGEIFITKSVKRFVSSTGIDEVSTSFAAQMEIVTDWDEEGKEAVEMFTVLDFSEFDKEHIEAQIKDAIENTISRAKAMPIPAISDVNVILDGENVREFFSYYPSRASVGSIYSRISDAKIGDNLQGEDVTGDKVSMTLKAEIKGSTRNSYLDSEGVVIDELELVKEGELMSYYGPNRISQYLKEESKGNYINKEVKGGSKTAEELKQEPYLHCIFFSDFQMNTMTGDFGGEIRLAKYFDGEKVIPVTGGSITGNIKDVQKDMLFSSETETMNAFKGPKIIRLKNVRIAS
jgi:PmbA protein